MVTVYLDGVKICLREAHDFTWLQSLGTVFAAFDQQDSGNLPLGVLSKDGTRRFVKYAGARTVAYDGDPLQAVDRLRQAADVFHALRHPRLVKLIDHFAVNDGYALVFEWVDGECLHTPSKFPPPAKYTHPDSPYYRFKALSIAQRLDCICAILSFHTHVEAMGYVAIDFYDGSIMYDFVSHETMLCDIDFYRPRPYCNTMGRLWGSSRFMSPEEFTLGAQIDERTNVFTMGAVAFALLGGETDRSMARWDASRPLYEVALRAVQTDRNRRYASVREFHEAWNVACEVHDG